MNTSCRSISVISALGLLILVTIFLACADLGDPVTRTNSALPELTINDITVAEGDTAVFVVTLSRPTNGHVTFAFSTSDSGATAPDDYVPAAGTDTIHPGETQDSIRVATENDAGPEPAERFKVTISSPEGAVIADQTGVATIAVSDGWIGVSFATQIKPLLDAQCLVCHGLIAPSSNFSVISYQSVMTSGNRGPNVTPFNGAASLLYRATTPGSPIDRMPQGGPYLTAQQQQLIKDWIDQGAADN